MNKKVFNYLKLAGQTALYNNDSRRNFFLGAVGIRKDGAIVRASNLSCEVPSRQYHAEYRCAMKLDYGAPEVYVARLRLDTLEFGIAKPCFSCEKVLRSKGVRRVYYSIGPTEYDVIKLT